ncbi:hypothetical protein FRC03_004345 [Tulasnella sp. 419]|nr:hypothetical protein FRC03_004345 [Tulasnella sp. 419]
MKKPLPKWLRGLRTVMFSRRGIAILKGSLAYILALLLIFLKSFDDLSAFAPALPAMMLVVAAGTPGKAIGSVLSGNLTGAAGLLVGSMNFYFLDRLSPWPTAQALYWFLSVYILAYIKAQGQRWFKFSLFAILSSFNGIIVSYAYGEAHNSTYLKEYLKSYLWGTAINLFVGLFVFPISSEKELRRTLVVSLEHVETFNMLVSRSFLKIISEEEKVLRNKLAQTIRADFGHLTEKLEETAIEINWSRWSMADYRYFIAKIRALQLALVSTHSSICTLETQETDVYRKAFLHRTLGCFNKVRMDMRLTIREIATSFGCEPVDLPRSTWVSYMDIERQAAFAELPRRAFRGNSFTDAADDADHAAALRAVAERLAEEISRASQDVDSDDEIDDPLSNQNTLTQSPFTMNEISQLPSQAMSTRVNSPTPSAKRRSQETTQEKVLKEKALRERGPKTLLADFCNFKKIQYEMISKTLTSGGLTDYGETTGLKVRQPQPSIHDHFGHDHVRGRLLLEEQEQLSSREVSPCPPKRNRRYPLKEGAETPKPEQEHPAPSLHFLGSSTPALVSKQQVANGVDVDNDHSLVRIYSFVFALSQFVQELHEFHERVTASGSRGRKPRKSIHFHFFESLNKPERSCKFSGSSPSDDLDLSLREAMAILESKPYEKPKVTPWDRVHNLKIWLTSNDSIYAAKAAAATSIFAVLLWANTTRQWFISYGTTSGLITVTVALAPTLGQSARTFILQVCGSALGYLLGLVVMEIFRNVGGYTFNPYGMLCLLAAFSLPLQYILYELPKYFTIAFLALYGAGTLLSTEWIYVEYLGKKDFDSPAYRTGKALASLAVAVAVCGTFQLLVARNPARRTLRKALAHLTYSNLAYITLLQAFVRAVIPADPNHSVPEAAITRVHEELKKREMKIQSEIIGIMPLLTFASAEPSLSHRFSPTPALRIINANQTILDRMREARDAIGTTRFDEFILKNFVAVLSPHRRRSAWITKTTLASCAASLYSKLPLPHDFRKLHAGSIMPDFVHDALILSHRLALTEEGHKSIHETGEFIRYWFYLLGMTSIHPQLQEIEEVCKALYGRLEDSLL